MSQRFFEGTFRFMIEPKEGQPTLDEVVDWMHRESGLSLEFDWESDPHGVACMAILWETVKEVPCPKET